MDELEFLFLASKIVLSISCNCLLPWASAILMASSSAADCLNRNSERTQSIHSICSGWRLLEFEELLPDVDDDVWYSGGASIKRRSLCKWIKRFWTRHFYMRTTVHVNFRHYVIIFYHLQCNFYLPHEPSIQLDYFWSKHKLFKGHCWFLHL